MARLPPDIGQSAHLSTSVNVRCSYANNLGGEFQRGCVKQVDCRRAGRREGPKCTQMSDVTILDSIYPGIGVSEAYRMLHIVIALSVSSHSPCAVSFTTTSDVVFQTEVAQRLHKRVRATTIDVTSTSGPSSSVFARPFMILRRKHTTSFTFCALALCATVAMLHRNITTPNSRALTYLILLKMHY